LLALTVGISQAQLASFSAPRVVAAVPRPRRHPTTYYTIVNNLTCRTSVLVSDGTVLLPMHWIGLTDTRELAVLRAQGSSYSILMQDGGVCRVSIHLRREWRKVDGCTTVISCGTCVANWLRLSKRVEDKAKLNGGHFFHKKRERIPVCFCLSASPLISTRAESNR
jgi:hypothetical protein